ncbi:hypothetical protein ACROYT_G029665 [Oculina patagonica]
MVGLLWLLVIAVTSSASMKCSKSVRSIKGMYLTGHVIISGSADGLGDCLFKCSDDPRCKSINFRFNDLFCELNDADIYTHAMDYGPSDKHAYSDYPAVKVTVTQLYMTPLWLEAHASYIDSSRTTTADQITFKAGSIGNAALLKVPLVSAGVLTDATPLTVEITVANDVSIGEKYDSDIRYGVSDGTSFIGFETVDKRNNDTHSPCYEVQATSGSSLTAIQPFAKRDPISSASFYPDQFVFTLKLDIPQGSCFTAHGGGFTKTAKYTKRLLLSQGLTLEVYKSTNRERVGIKYIKVTLR